MIVTNRFFIVWWASCLMSLFACQSIFGQQLSLFSKSGDAVAYIDYDQSSTIFLWNGEPVAFLESCEASDCIYNFKGELIGFFGDGVVYDLAGMKVGAIKSKIGRRTRLERVKREQQTIPSKPNLTNHQAQRKKISFQNSWGNTVLGKFFS